MKSTKYLAFLIMSLLFSSCHTEEKNKINSNLSEATKYLYMITNESPYSIMNQGNFTWLCEVSGFPTNFQSAQFMYANGSWNNAGSSLSRIESTILIASKIGNPELVSELQNLKSIIAYIRQNAFGAKDNYNNSKYDYYISEMLNLSRNALMQIEKCRQILSS